MPCNAGLAFQPAASLGADADAWCVQGPSQGRASAERSTGSDSGRGAASGKPKRVRVRNAEQQEKNRQSQLRYRRACQISSAFAREVQKHGWQQGLPLARQCLLH